jgi:DNA-binding transcriptional MerR regulator
MFRIGEFAQIGQVSTRQLRHYDHLGLLRPELIDRQTGYRYYGVKQLPRLNRLLALKELGLSLEQIGPMLNEQLTSAELRGMLAMKRAQVEQSLRIEEARLRHIETRIEQIDSEGGIDGFDVIVRPVPALPALMWRQAFSEPGDAMSAIQEIATEGFRRLRPALRDKLIVVAHNDDEGEGFDLEIGFSLTRQTNESLSVAGLGSLTPNILPAETMATLIRPGTNAASHSSFATIGRWISANNQVIAGACREIFLEPITRPQDFEGALVEIQFPIRPAA